MKTTHLYKILLSALISVSIPTIMSAAMAKQDGVDCIICCRATTGGSSNCRLDIERCAARWEYTCPSGKKVYCGTFLWSFIACREDTRPSYEECWDYTSQTCTNAYPANSPDYDCDQEYINQKCLENIHE